MIDIVNHNVHEVGSDKLVTKLLLFLAVTNFELFKKKLKKSKRYKKLFFETKYMAWPH